MRRTIDFELRRLGLAPDGATDWTSDVPLDQIPGLISHLAALQLRLTARQLQAQADRSADVDGGDTLLRVGAAAERLGTSVDWVYRHADQLLFTVRTGRRQLRFSSQGIDRYIKQRQRR